jgi:small-conductance mechanosensitive channel
VTGVVIPNMIVDSITRVAGVVLTVGTREPGSLDLDIGLILGAALTLALAYVIGRAATLVLRNASELTVEHRIAVKSLIPVVRFAVYVVAVVVVLGPLFVLTTSRLLAFSGVLGAVLGVGGENGRCSARVSLCQSGLMNPLTVTLSGRR